jgi:hypothetical protein
MGRADAAKLLTSDARGVAPSRPVFGLPGIFEKLVAAYPDVSVDDMKAMIGRADEDWIENACTLRVSHALNYAGLAPLRVSRAYVGEAT